MKKVFYFFVILCCFRLGDLLASDARETKKVLMLIIANDAPVYKELQKLWRSYMFSDREHVEAYFIKGDAHLKKPFKIKKDTLWTKTEDSLVPGILNKTVLSMEALLPRIQNEFDYVVRTNLSSFYIFPRLLKFLNTLPAKGCYSALIGESDGLRWGAGCGFILSSDMAELLVQEKGELLNDTRYADDVAIGKFFQDRNIEIIPAPRMDFYSLHAWRSGQGIYLPPVPHYPEHIVSPTIPKNVFHIRVKQDNARLRMHDDLIVYKELIRMFY